MAGPLTSLRSAICASGICCWPPIAGTSTRPAGPYRCGSRACNGRSPGSARGPPLWWSRCRRRWRSSPPSARHPPTGRTRELVALQVEIQEVAAGGALGTYVARPPDWRKRALDLPAKLLDAGQVGSVDLDAHRRAYARGEHVDAVLDGHGPRVGNAGDAHRLVHLVDQLVGRNILAPL